MNNRDDVPGYGYQIKKGATALTESWEALERKSNNHLMLGHLMEWFYKSLGGINQSKNSTAYKEIEIRPTIVGDLNNVKTSYMSPYGLIVSNWEIVNNTYHLNIRIPVNTSARVFFPVDSISEIYENKTLVAEIEEIKLVEEIENGVILKIGSGEYKFSMSLN
jgi:hypothetical protein